MKRYNELMDRLPFSFSFVNCLFFRYQLEFLKNKFCITNVLCHLLFSSRSPSSISQFRLCSRLFVKNVNDFVSSVKYHFSHIFVNKFSNKEIESVFAQERKTTFKLDVLFSSENHSELVDSIQNRCMIFFFLLKICLYV